MHNRFFQLAFTAAVQAEQQRHGSRGAYERLTPATDESRQPDLLGDRELEFIANRDSFYMATQSETGWPYVQHRGGPRGFVMPLAPQTLGWADFAGNRQYVSIGNNVTNDRVALFFMDYPSRLRLKVLGRMSVAEIAERPDLRAGLEVAGYKARIEHAIQVKVEAFDWNCPQHITPRYTISEVEALVAPLRQEIEDLKARLGRG